MSIIAVILAIAFFAIPIWKLKKHFQEEKI